MSEFWKNLSPGCRVHRSGKQVVDLSTLPSDVFCKKLYLEGFRHIAPLPAAERILKSCPKSKLESLLELKKKEKKREEVEFLTKLLEGKSKRK